MTSEGNRATGAMGFDFDPVAGHHAVPAGGLSWNRARGVPYLQDIGIHGYQVASTSRNSPAFMPLHPMRALQGSYYHPPVQPPPLPLLPPPPQLLPLQPQNMDIPVHLPSRRSTRTSSTHPFQNDADPGPSFVAPALPDGVMVYEARRPQFMIDSYVMQHSSFPYVRVLPEDEFLALREQIGNAGSGMSDNFISDHLKTRTFASFRQHSKDLMPADEEPNFCVICQMEFENQEKIGMLDCTHEYHLKCIKKWLIVKNNCPVCKSTALH